MMDQNDAALPTQEEIAYQAREKRIQDAIRLQKPDRVPLVCYDDYFCLSLGGLTPSEAYYNPDRAAEVHVEQITKFNWDMVSLFGYFPGKVGEIIGLKSNKWAGYNLPNTQEFQYVEQEYMLADEYDQFLKDPSDFVIRKLWPRMAEGLEPFGVFPSFLAMSHTFAPIAEIAIYVGKPEVREMLEKLIRVGEEMNAYNAAMDRAAEALMNKGFPVMVESAGAHAPFDWISDYFRGIKGSMLDMFYQPEKLKAAIEVVTIPIIEFAIKTAKDLGDNVVSIPLHRGADPFMSNDQFAEFYWPSLKQLLLALIDADLTPSPYWEGSYTSRLEFLAELPPGKIWGHFEVINLEKTKEIIGDTMCFWGNVPAQILISGTPSQTKDYVRKLIDIFGDNGGLIVDGAVGIPKEAKQENVMAMTEAVFEYGVY
jgi:uroporphyrinogen-III decarboxylase